MSNKHWQISDLPWDAFDPTKVKPDMLSIIKAASLVEYNGHDYADYLCNVFTDDDVFKAVARAWAVEEVQHGEALGQWAEKADPTFNFKQSVERFRAGYRIDLNTDASVRGSRAGELIARCIVETGTSSYYTALAEATDEPVLKEICRHIAADELRHYKLFYDHLQHYLVRDKLSRWERLKIGLSRIQETEDDELSYAYYAANTAANDNKGYDRATYNKEYTQKAYSYYKPQHVERVLAMVFKACGLKPHGWLQKLLNKPAYLLMKRKAG